MCEISFWRLLPFNGNIASLVILLFRAAAVTFNNLHSIFLLVHRQDLCGKIIAALTANPLILKFPFSSSLMISEQINILLFKWTNS